jgi:hypothetical protein
MSDRYDDGADWRTAPTHPAARRVATLSDRRAYPPFVKLNFAIRPSASTGIDQAMQDLRKQRRLENCRLRMDYHLGFKLQFAVRNPQSAIVLPFILLIVLARPLAAQTKSSAMGDGLSINADWWSLTTAGGGYCPVRVQITNATSRQRPLQVVIESRGSRPQSDVAQSLELPPGGKADFVLSMPITTAYHVGNLHVYERGRELKKLRIFGIGGNAWWGHQTIPMVAVVATSSPDLRNLTAAVSQVTTGQSASNFASYAPLLLKPADAPTKWIDYTMMDLILISARELEQMPAAARDALATWTLAGGNLFVYGLSDDRENAPELNRLLDIERRLPRAAAWRRPRVEDRNVEFDAQDGDQVVSNPAAMVTIKKAPGTGGAGSASGIAAASQSKANPEATKGASHFSVRPFGFGQLGASSSSELFPGTLEDWGWVIKTFKTKRIHWQERHGISARYENDDFWSFLIPGVGRAPVGGFQLLITLFAVLIGPINYLVLRRRGQLYFLIATVPALALVTTLMLLGYAVFSDGFALRARVRSVTMLDQIRGESVSWSRLSYYAGVAPSGGLRFSTDTAVYPIRPPGEHESNRTLDWTEGQRMPVGWLRSRTPTQLLAIHFRQSPEHLAVATSSTGTTRVTNHLGTAVRWLALADANGQILSAQSIAPEASERLESKGLDALHAELRELLSSQPLETPDEIASRYSNVGFFGSRVRFWGSGTLARWNNSRSEEYIQALLASGHENLQSMLQPRSYIAVTDLPPTVDLGVTEMQDEGSLFIVIGSY